MASEGLRRGVRWGVAAVGLLACYLALSALNSPEGFLGTDTGAKVATVRVMVERATFDPDVGYWAAAVDPDGRFHPLIYTERRGEQFLAVTSLPMVLAARPLWALGGMRLALLLPMAGAVATAGAAAALARRLGGDARWAFWGVGLTSPVVLYATDLWEHAIGLGCMAWGIVVAVDLVDRPTWWRGLVVGVAFGTAFSMRTEAAVYVVGVVGVVGVVLLARRQWQVAVVSGVAAVAGFVALIGANQLLEQAVIGSAYRSGRAQATAAGGGADLALRVKEALVTTMSPYPSFASREFVFAGVYAAALVAGAWLGSRPSRLLPALVALALAGFVLVDRAAFGLGWLPGSLAVAPLGGVALAQGGADVRTRLVVAFALVPLPLVFFFQFPGGALPQWGGRYLLLTTFCLVVVGLVTLPRLAPLVRWSFVGATVAVTVFGLAWVSQRTHAVAEAGRQLAAIAAAGDGTTVFVSPDGFVPREFAATYPEPRWLSVQRRADVDEAVEVARAAGGTPVLVELCPDDGGRVPSGAELGTGVTEVDGQRWLRFIDGCPLRLRPVP